ncbi:MAG: hypothetical protein ABIP33_06355 [Pseudolysinimonas sp.]
MTTLLMRGQYHSSDDNITAWCGIPVPPAAKVLEGPAVPGVPICADCTTAMNAMVLVDAQTWVTEAGETIFGIVGPCGDHLVGLAHTKDEAKAMRAMIHIPNCAIANPPTAEQLINLIDGVSCQSCQRTSPPP